MDTYPINTRMFNETFKDDAACLEYIYQNRWPDDFLSLLNEFVFRFNSDAIQKRVHAVLVIDSACDGLKLNYPR